MRTLRLGISPCPNDVYIFAGLLLGAVADSSGDGLRFEAEYLDVETLNQAAQRGEFDVVKISYANAPRIASEYELLDCGGALGRGVGPLLLCNGGGFSPDREILVPGAFTTANFLLGFYLQRPVSRRALPFDALYDHLCRTPGAQGVVIHEKRFTYERDGLTLVTDLGEHWEARTGLPIPLGAIAVRRSLGLREPVEALIRQSLRWAYDHDAEAFALCRRHAQDLNDGVTRAHIDLYVNGFSEDLGAEGRAAVAYFLAQQQSGRSGEQHP